MEEQAVIDALTPTHPALGSWDGFREWRRSKCPRGLPGDSHENAAMGLAGEMAEVAHKLWHVQPPRARNVAPLLPGEFADAVAGECGDVLFYADWLADCYGIGLQDAVGPAAEFLAPVGAGEYYTSDFMRALAQLGEAVDLTKKKVFHGVAVEPDKIKNCLRLGLVSLGVFLADFGLSWRDAAAAVAAKLDARYPGGFSPGGGNRDGAGA